MGNSNSGGKRYAEAQSFGDVYVELNQDNFVPGDTLTGTIYVNLRTPYSGDKLCLKVKGTEYTHWIDREARHRQVTRHRVVNGQRQSYTATETYYVDVTRESEKIIMKSIVDVYDWKHGTLLPAGQFSFPISFRIPDGIPGSFFLHRGRTIGEIRYRIEGFLKPDTANHPKLKHKIEILIREKVKKQIETTCLALDKPMKTWCCIDQGAVNAKTSFEKNAYAPSEEVRILAEVDNSKCKLNVQDIVFELTQTVVLQAKGHIKYLNYSIRTLSLGGLGAGETCIGDQNKHASMKLPPGQSGAAKHLKNNTNEQSPDPSQILTPSTHGALVKSDFHLKVRCLMDGCLCCDTNPTTDLPIQIYAPLYPKQPAPVPPVNWHPQPMPTVNLTINVMVPTQVSSPQPQFVLLNLTKHLDNLV